MPRGVFDVVFTDIFDEPGTTTGVGLKVTLVPAGRPDSESDTDPVKPRIDEIETVYVAVRPRLIETTDGLTPMAKSGGGAETTRLIGAPWLVDPLVPVTVSGYVPGVAVVDVVMVSCEDPAPPETTAGENENVPTDAGSPANESWTSPEKPLIDVTPTLEVTSAPATTLCVDGVAATEKSGGADTARVAAVVRVVEPLVPVTVNG